MQNTSIKQNHAIGGIKDQEPELDFVVVLFFVLFFVPLSLSFFNKEKIKGACLQVHKTLA